MLNRTDPNMFALNFEHDTVWKTIEIRTPRIVTPRSEFPRRKMMGTPSNQFEDGFQLVQKLTGQSKTLTFVPTNNVEKFELSFGVPVCFQHDFWPTS